LFKELNPDFFFVVSCVPRKLLRKFLSLPCCEKLWFACH